MEQTIKTLRVHQDVHNKIKALAAMRNKTIEEVVEVILNDYFEKNKEELKR